MRGALRIGRGAEERVRDGEGAPRVRTNAAAAGPQQGPGNRWVQHLLRAGAREPGAWESAEAAERGAAATGSRLAHGGEIQRAFGRHDVSGLVAHVGGEASAAARSIGARGFASGRHLVFDAAPSLRVAAHEAAHAVQQRHLGGAPRGAAHRACEDHAEAVAEAVAEGRTAEPLLDAFAAAPAREVSPGGAVQRVTDEAQLAAPLKLPDALAREADIFAAETAVARARTLTQSTRIKIVEAAKNVQLNNQAQARRLKIEWYEWAAGWQVKEGYVDEGSIAYGGNAQTDLAVNDDNFKIKPANAAGIDPKDVLQTGLSDCYLQAAMIGLAMTNRQALFDAIVVANDHVIVKLYLENGELPKVGHGPLVRTDVRLSRSLFLDANQQPVYGGRSGANRYLWPAFIGKAFAVLKGSYAATSMGQARYALRALTGQGEGCNINEQGALKLYTDIRDALAANRPAVLATTSFAKWGLYALWNGIKHKSRELTRPQGEVRGLHAYAVVEITPDNVAPDAFADAKIPDVVVRLRDPRDASGGSFTRKLKDIYEAGKFQSVHTG